MKKPSRYDWTVPAFFGALALAGAVGAFFSISNMEKGKAQALEQGIPAVVSLNDFDLEKDVHAANEVNVRGWINSEYNYELTLTEGGRSSATDEVRRMFVLFGPDDAGDSKQARAALLFEPDMTDELLAEIFKTGEVQNGQAIATVNGERDESPDLEDLAWDALRKEGLITGANFMFISPWERGREKALEPDDKLILYVPGFLILVALVCGFFVMRARKKWVRYQEALAALPAEARKQIEQQEKAQKRKDMIKGVLILGAIAALYYYANSR